MSPIFVRPVREQLEHDRLVRFLQNKYKRKFEVAANMGEEQVAPVKIGSRTLFPDLVLTDKRKIAGIVEVESGESVNNLEAMAQWAHFSRARVPFHLYVPVSMFENARRLCAANNARVSEIWTYRPALDGFDLVRMSADTGSSRPSASSARPAANGAKNGVKAKPAAVPPVTRPAKPATPATPAGKPAKPAAKPAPKAAAARKPAAEKKPAAKAKAVKRKR